jgi:hypothetical protein
MMMMMIIHQDSIINAHMYSRTAAIILVRLQLSLLDSFENGQISNYMKIRPVGAELLHADRQPHQS